MYLCFSFRVVVGVCVWCLLVCGVCLCAVWVCMCVVVVAVRVAVLCVVSLLVFCFVVGVL